MASVCVWGGGGGGLLKVLGFGKPGNLYSNENRSRIGVGLP